ncbi:hypothetical protein [Paludisphaera soli]|uniref:hypothetical protein n=1 Tax=Paludisphaera soli TaxID=2712865 RepID=UPI0013EC8FFB|nr:hypothetical protein [Paludisphaera soli]
MRKRAEIARAGALALIADLREAGLAEVAAIEEIGRFNAILDDAKRGADDVGVGPDVPWPPALKLADRLSLYHHLVTLVQILDGTYRLPFHLDWDALDEEDDEVETGA